MDHATSEPECDEWSDWLLHRRHADDPEYECRVRAVIERFAARILDRVPLVPGMTVVDVGTGDGLVAFAAIDRMGPSLKAILTDVSAPMLRHAAGLAKARGIQDQCRFLPCPADRLDGLPDSSVDLVTTRAVLAYVDDKRGALREFHRVLKPGGRLSIGEPVFRDDAIETIALRNLIEAHLEEPQDQFLRLLHRWKGAQFPDTLERMASSPLTNYTERDLVHFAQEAGFVEIQLEFCMDVLPSIITSWEAFLGCSPHPWAPTVGTILKTQFTADERQMFETALRPTIDGGAFTTTERIAYLCAVK